MGEPIRICGTCGHTGKVKVHNRGSVIVLLCCVLFFIIPGVVYLLYMLTGNYHTCRACGSREVIGLETPRGRELVARYGGVT